MAVRPVDLQDSSKSATVVRSDSAVAVVLADWIVFSGDYTDWSRLTRRAREVGYTVDIELTALGSVEGWAEVGRGALESCG
jgi:hypothetical protein